MHSAEPTSVVCPVTYAALRAGFVAVLDCLLRYSRDPLCTPPVSTGFFDCYPLLSSVSPQVQLECLLRTWNRCLQSAAPDVLDEFVCYAAYEKLASLAASEDNRVLKVILNGPANGGDADDVWIATKTRCLQFVVAGSPGTVIWRQLESPQDSIQGRSLLSSWGQIESQLMELLSIWRASKGVVLGSQGLLTEDEQEILRAFFEEHPGLVR